MDLKVLHVARSPMSGVWSVICSLAQWQRQRGYTTGIGIMMSSIWPESYRSQLRDLERDGILVFHGSSPNIFGTGAYLWHDLINPVSRWIGRFDASGRGRTVVHFHNAWLSGAFHPVRPHSVRTCATYHGVAGESELRVQPFRRFLHGVWARRLVQCGVKLVSVDQQSPYIAEDLFGVGASRFCVIPNGVPEPSFGPQGCLRLRDPSQPFTVGHVGTIDGGKGWRITAEAVSAIHSDGFPIRFVVAGSGPQSDQVKEWCGRNASFAKYLGFVSDPVASVFPMIDVLSLPSQREGLPMAIVESLSHGIPILATSVGGIPDAVTNGYNGFLVDRSKAGVKAGLLSLVRDPELHREFSTAARARYEAQFSQEAMGVAYETVYQGGDNGL